MFSREKTLFLLNVVSVMNFFVAVRYEGPFVLLCGFALLAFCCLVFCIAFVLLSLLWICTFTPDVGRTGSRGGESLAHLPLEEVRQADRGNRQEEETLVELLHRRRLQ